MPIDVAVEEPRARVIGIKANRDFIPSSTYTHDIPDNRIIKVVGRVSSAADHMEVVSVQMNRMLLREATGINLTSFKQQSVNAHGDIKDPTRNGQLNTLVWTETVDAACGK